MDRRLGAGYGAFGIETALIDPGKTWQNGALESFNGKFRDESVAPSAQILHPQFPMSPP